MIQFSIIWQDPSHVLGIPDIPNDTLVQEESSLAALYRNKSVAEQQSIDLAWDLLMDESFVDLRRVLYTTTDEFSLLQKPVSYTTLTLPTNYSVEITVVSVLSQ